jgi:phosphate transport system substrate-binding protein
VDGSTSALPLQATIACHLLDVTCDWVGGEEDEEFPLFFGEGRRIMPVLFAEPPDESVEMIYSIWHTGTHTAYVNLIEGNADFILVARSPSQDERIASKGHGVELDVRPVALDAFVFLVNTANPVDDLTTEAIRDIYTGQITDWAALGGPDESIQAYLRNENSGSQELMKTLVMQDLPMIDAPDMILESMMGPINAIGEDPLGIGYSVYFYASYILPSQQIKLIGVDGVHPTSDTIATRTYPLATEVYAVVRADTPPDSTAVMLRDWLFTEEGQATIAESGYVPLEP